MKFKTGPSQEREGRKKQPLQIGRINKQGNLEFVLGGCKRSRSLHPSARILTVYSGFCLLGTASSEGTVGGMYISRTEEGERSLRLPRSSSLVNGWSHPLEDFSQQKPKCS